MDLLDHGDFAENLNTNFRIVGQEQSLDLELIEAEKSKIAGANEAFSLVFRGGKDLFLPQGLYNIEHDSLDSGTIFLVPVGEEENGYLYEAVFSRMKPKSEDAA